MNWDDSKVLLAIGRTGGLGRSAKLLGVSTSTIHRKAVELENSLNATLFSRGKDGYTLTEVGEHFFALAEKAEEHLVAMERYNAKGHQSSFRIALPELVGQQVLQSQLIQLQNHYPDLQLNISTSVVPVDFARREADIIVRLTRPETGRYVIRRLGKLEYGLYCSEPYRSGSEKIGCLGDLSYHRLIGWDNSLQYTFPAQWMNQLTQGGSPTLSFDNMQSQLLASKDGAGVVVLPCFAAERAGLYRVLPEQGLLQDVWLMRHEETKGSVLSGVICSLIENELQAILSV
ncbi:LysR family transcriptional regulator [Vibrio coralliilyticus]|uniref:LysR family transcriptional regulator n=1 Tax=Vibrio TaxID=662 RepID=UPI000502E1D2|nr:MULTISPECIES: LysR family transcriptional regulator [Vibrio]KFI13415.1 LysR family transcriptional regulator [Vibrio sp. B183]NOI20525.1 LysR family transcriptional regulator [Vibrio coralliilyticus]